MENTPFFFVKKLEKYPYIRKYYNSFFSKNKKAHPLTCHLVCDTRLLEFDLERLEKMLKKLDNTTFLPSIIKESRNPTQFFDQLSEMKVATKFFDCVDYIEKIPKKPTRTPDFEIRINGISISIEVKRIRDKLFYNHSKTEYAQIIDDEKTIRSHIIKSALTQIIAGKPHILIFDCCFSTPIPTDFERILYLQKGDLEFNSRTQKIKDKNEPTERIFHEKNESGEYKYANLSGVIGIFDKNCFSGSQNSENKSLIITNWSSVFYRNPHVKHELKIVDNIIDQLGLEKFQILDEKLQD